MRTVSYLWEHNIKHNSSIERTGGLWEPLILETIKSLGKKICVKGE